MDKPTWLKGWKGTVIYAAAVLLVVYGAYAAFVSYSNGDKVTLNLEVGTNQDGTMYLRCAAGSTPTACTPNESTFTVHKRDRVTVNVHNADGGKHTHDIRLVGGPYWLWPGGFENELESPDVTAHFTAYSTGTFEVICELAGHYDAGMKGTLVVS